MAEQLKIFCDLDGTLIDVSKRHYRVYTEMVAAFSGEALPQDKYWELKRKKVKWAEMLPMSQLSPDIEPQFLAGFIEKIESPEHLELDELYPGAMDALDTLSGIGECNLVSLRRNRDNLLQEIARLGLAQHFSNVLTGHSENDGYDVKIALIKDRLGDNEGIIIGDTEADIVTGKELGLKTFAVTSGIRDEQFLRALDPDFIVDGISKVPELL